MLIWKRSSLSSRILLKKRDRSTEKRFSISFRKHREKKKWNSFAYFDYQNINSPCFCHHYVNSSCWFCFYRVTEGRLLVLAFLQRVFYSVLKVFSQMHFLSCSTLLRRLPSQHVLQVLRTDIVMDLDRSLNPGIKSNRIESKNSNVFAGNRDPKTLHGRWLCWFEKALLCLIIATVCHVLWSQRFLFFFLKCKRRRGGSNLLLISISVAVTNVNRAFSLSFGRGSWPR